MKSRSTGRSVPWPQPEYFPNVRGQHYIRMAAAHAPLGRLAEARQALAELNRIWPYDTIRTHFPHDLNSRVHATQNEKFQDAPAREYGRRAGVVALASAGAVFLSRLPNCRSHPSKCSSDDNIELQIIEITGLGWVDDHTALFTHNLSSVLSSPIPTDWLASHNRFTLLFYAHTCGSLLGAPAACGMGE